MILAAVFAVAYSLAFGVSLLLGRECNDGFLIQEILRCPESMQGFKLGGGAFANILNAILPVLSGVWYMLSIPALLGAGYAFIYGMAKVMRRGG